MSDATFQQWHSSASDAHVVTRNWGQSQRPPQSKAMLVPLQLQGEQLYILHICHNSNIYKVLFPTG